jgi:hypothetical protein
MIIGDEVRNLDGDVFVLGEESEPIAPSAHALGVAVDRAAAVVKDELLVRERRRELGRVGELAREHHQIEGDPVPSKQAKAGAPGRIVHDAVAGGEAAGGIGIPAQYVAHADDAVEGGMRFDQRRRLRAGERHVHDIAGRDALRLVQRLQPARLADAVVSNPAGFDMDAGDDVVLGGIPKIVLGKIVPPQRAKLTQAAALARGCGEPGVPAEAEVPEMMMGVDDRSRVGGWHAFLAGCGERRQSVRPSFGDGAKGSIR